ncbi:MAG: glutamate--tRNA ligase, partial [Spirochaetota bacterium]
MSIRVRYAPSPTGLQHIGGLRTALFNYLLARSSGGSFILRIEDTDRERFDERSLKDIYDTFDWFGIRWDEGPDIGGPFAPYIQSERVDRYRDHARKLVDAGFAYEAFDNAGELREAREDGKQGYEPVFRDMPEAEKQRYRDRGMKPVIRFRTPDEGSTEFEDLVLGRVKRKNKDIVTDPVLLKSDGFPTYHLAVVVDDHHMEISHVLRGQEWVPTTGLHVLLYQAFGWEPPRFCHLPMVLGKDGQKLSKRHGATSVIEFRNAGYLPEAVMNYLSRLGWSYDDSREFFSRQDLETLFDVEKLSKSPAVFDYRKLDWYNGSYIREKNDNEIYNLILPFLVRKGLVSDPPDNAQEDTIRTAVPLIRERLRVLSDASNLLRFVLTDIGDWSVQDLVPKKTAVEDVPEYLLRARDIIQDADVVSDEV